MISEQRLRETETYFHEQIPLTQAMGVKVERSDAEGFVLRAPLAPNHNHLGTAFGGSLAALALLAGYGFLWLELDDRRAHLVISESQLRFRRPVRGELCALCRRPDGETLARFKEDFARKQKARISLECVIFESEEIALTARGVYVAIR